jgi:cytochrome c551/c552
MRMMGVTGRFLIGCLLLILAACGGGAPAEILPTRSAEQKLGATVFSQECARCHSLEPETVIVGPSLHGIADRAGSRVSDQDAAEYLLVSILVPADYIVADFDDLMPTSLGTDLTSEELDAVIAFLLTQTE